jgi:hypothetical protein
MRVYGEGLAYANQMSNCRVKKLNYFFVKEKMLDMMCMLLGVCDDTIVM